MTKLLKTIIVALALLGAGFAQTQLPFVSFGPISDTGPINFSPKQLPAATYASGTVIWWFSTGAAATGCTLTFEFGEALSLSGGQIVGGPSISPAISVNPGLNGGQGQSHILGRTNGTTDFLGPWTQLALIFQCSTSYPATGTLYVEFIPDPQPVYHYAHVNTNATTTWSNQPVILHTLVINAPGTSETLTIYDSSACPGIAQQVVAAVTISANDQYFLYDTAMQQGLCVVTAGTTAGDYTLTYR